MSTRFHAILLREPHCNAHVIKVRTMKTASDICQINMRHDSSIIAQLIKPKPLAHVTVDYSHCNLLFLQVCRILKICKIEILSTI